MKKFLWFWFLLVSGCSAVFGSVVSGKIHFEDARLTSTAYMTVTLRDTSYADAPAKKIAEFQSEVRSSPAHFKVSYNSSNIKEKNEYSLGIAIYEDEARTKLLFINDTHVGVITKGNPKSVEVRLKSVK